MGPCMNTIGNVGFLIIAAVGGWLAIKGNFSIGFLPVPAISVGTIQAFITYSKSIYFIGRCDIFEKRSFRIVLTVYCESFAAKRV